MSIALFSANLTRKQIHKLESQCMAGRSDKRCTDRNKIDWEIITQRKSLFEKTKNRFQSDHETGRQFIGTILETLISTGKSSQDIFISVILT